MQNTTKEKTYILGFYNPTDYYYAHLCEHYLAVYLRGALHIPVSHANCGAGYIFLEIICSKQELHTINDLINSGVIDYYTITHERDITVSEMLLDNRVKTYREIYESFETNSSTVAEKETLFESFQNLSSTQLIDCISHQIKNMKWNYINEKDLPALTSKKTPFTQEKTSKFTFTKSKVSDNKITYTEIDLVLKTKNKSDDSLLGIIHEELLTTLNELSRVVTAYKIQGAIFETSNQRTILHYATFMPSKHKAEFYELANEHYTNILETQAVINEATLNYKEYIAKRSPMQLIHEIGRYNKISDGSEKFTVDNSSPLIYKR